jgi:hypothetical protein
MARKFGSDNASENDGLLDLMRHHRIPITRESYLELAYMGEPPEELSAEEEMNLPPEQRKLKA